MSWFTDLAGKAEDFLVKIDENAAVAAQVINKEKTSSKTRFSSPATSPTSNDNESSPTSSSVSSSTMSSGKTLKLDRDSTLMASLNINSSTDIDSNQSSFKETSTDFSVHRENELLKQEVKSLNQEIRKSIQSNRQLDKDCKTARQQLGDQIGITKALENQLATIKTEKKSLMSLILDKDAELLTLKSQVEAFHINTEYQLELGSIHGQLEAEISQRKGLESVIKSQLADFEKERATLTAASQSYHEQLQAVRNELAAAHQSHTEYKCRAQRILLVISSLLCI